MENEENKSTKARQQETRSHVIKTPKVTIIASDDADLWNADWNIFLTGHEEEKIGTFSFSGEKVLGAVPINLELGEEYRNKGYGTEIVATMASWAFHFKNIYELKAVTDRENDKWVKVLKKNGFVYRDSEGRTEYYSRTKPKTAWTGLYLFLGIFLGFILGIVFAHIVTGMIAGIAIGVSIGLSMDLAANKEREKVTGKQFK